MGMSTATQLTSVQSAISAIEGGAQSYTINGRTVTKANLADLYDREEQLLARQARENRGSQFKVARMGRMA